MPTASVVQLRRVVHVIRPAIPATVYRRLTTLPAEEAQIDWGAFGSIRIGHVVRRQVTVFPVPPLRLTTASRMVRQFYHI